MQPIIALFLQYLPSLIKAGTDVYEYVEKMKETFKQQGVWTEEEEKAFTAELEALKSNPPAWWVASD